MSAWQQRSQAGRHRRCDEIFALWVSAQLATAILRCACGEIQWIELQFAGLLFFTMTISCKNQRHEYFFGSCASPDCKTVFARSIKPSAPLCPACPPRWRNKIRHVRRRDNFRPNGRPFEERCQSFVGKSVCVTEIGIAVLPWAAVRALMCAIVFFIGRSEF